MCAVQFFLIIHIQYAGLAGKYPPTTSLLLPVNSSLSEKLLPKKYFHLTPVHTNTVVASGPQRGDPLLRAGNSSGITTLDLHTAAVAV